MVVQYNMEDEKKIARELKKYQNKKLKLLKRLVVAAEKRNELLELDQSLQEQEDLDEDDEEEDLEEEDLEEETEGDDSDGS